MQRKKTYLIAVAIILLILGVWELWDYLYAKKVNNATKEIYTNIINETISINMLSDNIYVAMPLDEFKNPITNKEIDKSVKENILKEIETKVYKVENATIEYAFNNYTKKSKELEGKEVTFIYINIKEIEQIDKKKYLIVVQENINGSSESIAEKSVEYIDGKWTVKEISRVMQ